MAIIGSSFSKMLVEKKAAVKGRINVSNDVVFTEVEKSELVWGAEKRNVLRVMFEFKTRYEPKIGEILLAGDVLYYDDVAKLEELEKMWKKDKKLTKDVTQELLTHLFAKCDVESVILSRELNLPPPIQLRRVLPK